MEEAGGSQEDGMGQRAAEEVEKVTATIAVEETARITNLSTWGFVLCSFACVVCVSKSLHFHVYLKELIRKISS